MDLQPGGPQFGLVGALLVLLDQAGSAVALARFGALASPRLVLVVWVVFLVLHPQPLGLLDEWTLLCLREQAEDETASHLLQVTCVKYTLCTHMEERQHISQSTQTAQYVHIPTYNICSPLNKTSMTTFSKKLFCLDA